MIHDVEKCEHTNLLNVSMYDRNNNCIQIPSCEVARWIQLLSDSSAALWPGIVPGKPRSSAATSERMAFPDAIFDSISNL